MIERVVDGARTTIEHFFPERQIYHRSNGEVRYLSLSTRTQILASLGAVVFLIWITYATASVFLSGHLLSSQSRQSLSNRAHYQRLLAEARAKEASMQSLLETRTNQFNVAADDFERRLDTLKLLLDHVNGPVLLSSKTKNDGSGELMMRASRDDQTPRQSRYAALANVNSNAKNPLDRMAALHAAENQLLRHAEEQAEKRVENLHAVLDMTGIGLDSVLGETGKNTGGPFIALDEADDFAKALSLDKPFARRVARVAARMAEADQLVDLVHDIPLDQPLKVAHRFTSGFGARVDPITHRAAHHSGQDFGAFRLAPILATAPGKVDYAGWRSGYGRLVEIDHGYGFKTRYGHMAKIMVKRGQTVTTGMQIGAMGSSGRSTGVHLHYEVWFKGKPYDPKLFLKAGRYVQQG